MAIRKISDLHFPDNHLLMLDNGKWYLYSDEMGCPVENIDRRLAHKLIDTGFVGNKYVDNFGRLMYSRPTKRAADVCRYRWGEGIETGEHSYVNGVCGKCGKRR